ncbi:MAG TPA: protein kinase, partial [Streptosporangiaceae bacterium]|nr:protein kinase [Streptosporangiaceae bacterium]
MDMTLARAPIGQLLDGRYRVESYLARGGMATVYLGMDTRLERTVALKVMHAEFADDEDFVRRFVTEAKSVARLSHPNVVAVFDQGADGRSLYLAMEYVPGRTLRELLSERGRLGPAEALTIMDGVLAGLAAAHDAGLAHRDVKPENVLLGARAVKVADFGLATLVSGESYTKSGMIIGTAAYLAPEQVAGRRADARTDIYAAGVMLFELLTGTQPHTADSPLAVAYKHVNDVVPPPSSIVPGLPPALDMLVTMATSRDPDLRPADAGQFLRAVSEVRRGMSLPGRQTRGRHSAVASRIDAETIPPGMDAGTPWAGPPGSTTAAGRDLVPGLQPPRALEPRRASLTATQRVAPMEPGANHTLVVSAVPDAYGMGAPAYGGPRESRLQQLLFSRSLAYLALGVAAVLVVALLGWWVFAGQYTTVPKVGKLSVSEATADLRGAGLSVSASKTE